MSKLPEKLEFKDIFIENGKQKYLDEHTRKINEIISYLDETAKEKECEHKDTNWNSTFQILRCKDCGKAL